MSERFHGIFERRAAIRMDRVALTVDGRSTGYGERLDTESVASAEVPAQLASREACLYRTPNGLPVNRFSEAVPNRIN